MRKILLLMVAIVAIGFTSCSSDDDIPQTVTQQDLQGKWIAEYYGNIYSFEFTGNEVHEIISKYPNVLEDMEGTFTLEGTKMIVTLTKPLFSLKVGDTREYYDIHWESSDKTKINISPIGVLSKTKN
jgi:hypothetical protein